MEFAVNQVEQRLCLQTKSANNTLNYQATEQVLMHLLNDGSDPETFSSHSPTVATSS